MLSLHFFILYFHLILIFSLQTVFGSLDKKFLYYEVLPKLSFPRSSRVKRSHGISSTFKIKFKQKNYNLLLDRKVANITADNFKVSKVDEYNVKTTINSQFELFHGHVEGSESSSVSAIYAANDELDMLFIQIDDLNLIVEPLKRYEKHKNADELYELAYIVYSPTDLKYFNFNDQPSCLTNDTNELDKDHKKMKLKKTKHKFLSDYLHNPQKEKTVKPRKKRESLDCNSEKYKVCELLVVVDSSFYTEIASEDEALVTRLVISLVDMANSVIRDVTFGSCGSGFAFRVANINIYKKYSKNRKHFNTKDALDPHRLLQYFGHNKDLKNYCLGHLLTARSFPRNTLGLSNVASSELPNVWRIPHGGICSNYFAVSFNQSLYTNTGLTTFKHTHMDKIPSLQAALVFVHELVHSLGSIHDNSTECSPSKYPGKFLMHHRAVSGFEPNNKKLSACSISKIAEVLKKKAHFCFKPLKKNYCGNHKVEEGEECDEGIVNSQVHKCCDVTTCKLKSTSQCSDLNHDCCHACRFASNLTQCGAKDHCHSPAYCLGNSTTCGPVLHLHDAESCITRNHERGRCSKGKCLTLCRYNHMDSCLCTGVDSCKVCCKESAHERAWVGSDEGCKVLQGGLSLLNGTACDKGFCSNGVCIETEGGTLNRLWEILRINNINQFVIFMKNNIVGLTIIFSLVVWIPAVVFIDRYDKNKIELELKNCSDHYSIRSTRLCSSTDKLTLINAVI